MLTEPLLAQELADQNKLLLAVSGGSDSLAMLHLIATNRPAPFCVATVDHGLRTEAAEEAKFVARICRDMGVEHATLSWSPSRANSPSSQTARQARYELLVDEARRTHASAIVLGHTKDDQAETLYMRALRDTPTSSTLGFSGIAAMSFHHELTLLRPLLNERREALRQYLTSQRIDWIDDPSNENATSERVRARWALMTGAAGAKVEQLAHLAELSRHHRSHINARVAEVLQHKAYKTEQGYGLENPGRLPKPVLQEVIAQMIWITGASPFKPARDKCTDIIDAATIGKKYRKAVGRTLVEVKSNGLFFSPEKRGRQISDKPCQVSPKSGTPIGNGPKNNDISASHPLWQFRPHCDDRVFQAVVRLLQSPSRST